MQRTWSRRFVGIHREKWKNSSTSKWINSTISIIMGIGAVKLKEEGKIEHESTKYKIMITEAIWTIWKARNRRVIEGKEINKDILINNWNEAIEKRIRIDYDMIKMKQLKFGNCLLEEFK